jgi:hypothetical protein
MKNLGGTGALLAKLDSREGGLEEGDLERRKRVFGSN